jgi:hypothetical protein
VSWNDKFGCSIDRETKGLKMDIKRRSQHIKYDEGQWFAVPLQTKGYAVGIVARGNYKTKGGIGYFFNLRLIDIPSELNVSNIRPSDAILITWFGDLGIITGKWPLLRATCDFHKHEWPVPRFARMDAVDQTKGWLIEYDQNYPVFGCPIQTNRCETSALAGLPIDVLSGAVSVEFKLTKMLEAEGSLSSDQTYRFRLQQRLHHHG